MSSVTTSYPARLSVRVPPTLLARLHAAAARRETRPAELARRIVTDALARLERADARDAGARS